MSRELMLDLMVSRATEGLSETDDRKLERLVAGQDEMSIGEIDEAAAVADLAFHGSIDKLEPIPEELKRRILFDAFSRLRPRRADRSERPRPRGEGPLAPRYLGWYAAAAVLILAILTPWRTGPGTSPPTAVAPSVAQQRVALIEQAADLIRVDWAPPEIAEYAGVRGDVVWSSERQAGYMRLVGLPPNLPREAQYQLWIVDPERDKHPIDGGVFDITGEAGEVIVPIDAKLDVGSPAAFAITLEQPGGVVVSDGPLLVVAPVT